MIEGDFHVAGGERLCGWGRALFATGREHLCGIERVTLWQRESDFVAGAKCLCGRERVTLWQRESDFVAERE